MNKYILHGLDALSSPMMISKTMFHQKKTRIKNIQFWPFLRNFCNFREPVPDLKNENKNLGKIMDDTNGEGQQWLDYETSSSKKCYFGAP